MIDLKGTVKQNIWKEVSKRVPKKKVEKKEEEVKDEQNTEEPKTEEEPKKEDEDVIKIENVTISNMEDLNDLKKLSSDYETIKEWKEENKTHKMRLTSNFTLHGLPTLTENMKTTARTWLWKLDDRDKKIYEKRQAKNDFEALIYKSWEWVAEDQN